MSSFWVSAVTAVVGAVVGALVCYALLGTRAEGALRTVVDSASSVLAQFGGVMLAFAFIATIGNQGLITKFAASMRSGSTSTRTASGYTRCPACCRSTSTSRCR